jgi:hypothetical protein
MLDAHLAGSRSALQRQFGGDHHGVEADARHNGEHLGHDPVAARVAQQRAAQFLQRLGHVGEGGPFLRAPGFLSSSGM